MNKMICPHCKRKEPVFESSEPIPIHLTIEQWRFDDPLYQIATRLDVIFICTECQGQVKMNFQRKDITAVGKCPNPPPSWSSEMDQLIDDLRTSKYVYDGDVLKAANHGYHLKEGMTTKEAIREILINRPD